MSICLVNPAWFVDVDEWHWLLQHLASELTVGVLAIVAEETAKATSAKKQDS